MLPRFAEHSATRLILLTSVIAFISFLQFYHLSELPVVQWDESRLAVNAAEMSRSGRYLVSTYENAPDLYNTKPPLMIWLQVCSARIFGLNEFAIRFPSAMAGFCTILLCGWIMYRHTGKLYAALLAMLILACSNGFIQLHGSMTGDYDALLAFFILLSVFFFHSHFYRGEKRAVAFVTSMSLAIMTKSAAAFIIFPALATSLFVYDRFTQFRKFILYCFLSTIPFICFCLIREQAAPGYLAAMWDNDFIGRLSTPREGHKGAWHYYIVNLFDYRYNIFIWLLPPALAGGFLFKNSLYRYYALCLVLFIFFLSLAQTRIEWYDTPALPLIAIVITFFIFEGIKAIPVRSLKAVCTLAVIAGLVIAIPAKFMFIYKRKGLKLDMGHYELSHFIRDYKGPGQAKYIANWYDAEFFFYTRYNPLINRGKFKYLETGDTVFMGNMYKDSLGMVYEYKVLAHTQNAQQVRITGRK